MDSSLLWIIDIVQKEVRRRISDTIKRNQEKYEDYIKRQRGLMILKWFVIGDGTRWSVDKQQHVDTRFSASGINATITFHSYTFTEGVGDFERAEAWKARKAKDGIALEKNEPSEEYVSKLIWEEGIIGLPADSTVSDWVNPCFHRMDEPLDQYMQTTTDWDIVEEQLKQMISNDIN
ncbi:MULTISPECIES: hypothetical protein [unclassified Holdemanella]|jgi:hypothetical protein|uniref:hypothetical protein n=1 Tax=unclassified Holdemanella TaxID=2633909 RepID=UPI001D0B0C34|nr:MULTISPECIES: hypothetical protein [unclassified Holdemanella]MCB8639965.1 hypothetical protein [Holdemanella sp. DFI.5.55]MCG5648954.1 hypothetical protein [Holdemanella sp. DFI.5.21]